MPLFVQLRRRLFLFILCSVRWADSDLECLSLFVNIYLFRCCFRRLISIWKARQSKHFYVTVDNHLLASIKCVNSEPSKLQILSWSGLIEDRSESASLVSLVVCIVIMFKCAKYKLRHGLRAPYLSRIREAQFNCYVALARHQYNNELYNSVTVSFVSNAVITAF